MAKIAYGLDKGKLLNAVSVRFVPIRWDSPKQGKDGVPAVPGRRFLEQELLEVSDVAIPANPNALALGLKSGAVAKSDLQEIRDLLRCIESSSLATTKRSEGGSSLRAVEVPQVSQPAVSQTSQSASLKFLKTIHKLLRS
jgi:hypothetical protein